MTSGPELKGSGSIDVDRRELLGIVYCPRCKQDTIPDERTGRCFFCNRQIVEPMPRRRVVSFPVEHVRCHCGHAGSTHDHRGRCFECPCALFTPAEVSTA